MITYKKEIHSFEDLKNLCWSGAVDSLRIIEKNNLADDFMQYLEEVLYDCENLTDTGINDFIWFDCDEWIEEYINRTKLSKKYIKEQIK